MTPNQDAHASAHSHPRPGTAEYAEHIQEEVAHFAGLYSNPSARESLFYEVPETWTELEARAARLVAETSGADMSGHVVTRLAARPGVRMLSVGAGTGGVELYFAEQVPTAEIVCMDVNPQLLDLGRERAVAAGRNMRFLQADLNLVELPKQEFDLVFCHAALHHVIELERLVEQIKQSLRPEGEFITADVITRNGYAMWPETREVVQAIWRTLPPGYRVNHTAYNEPRTDEEIWEADTSAHGMECIRSEDILPILNAAFTVDTYVPYWTISRRFFDLMYGPNYVLDRPLDRAMFDWIWQLDNHHLADGSLRPETFFGIYRNPMSGLPRRVFPGLRASEIGSTQRAVKSVRSFFDALLADGNTGQVAWLEFRDQLYTHCLDVSARLGERLKEDALDQMLTLLVLPVIRNAVSNPATYSRFFAAVESMGFHVLPAHFYSPVPNVGELSKRDWDRKIGESLAFDASKQLDWVRGLQAWNKELADVPAEADASRAHLYHWNNPGFAPLDASVYYAAIRQYQPRRIIEVGGGFSTLIAAQAVRMFPADQRPALTCVEPFPVEALTIGVEGLDRLIGSPVQDVPLHLFDQLEVNDILFIDSSHVSKAASDVNYLILEVLPRLKPGVLVHIHDIFLPWDYPRDWVLNLRNFWNEQYVVHAFLLCNSGFDVLAANWFLSREHRPALVEALPSTPVQSGDSLWLLRRPTRAEG